MTMTQGTGVPELTSELVLVSQGSCVQLAGQTDQPDVLQVAKRAHSHTVVLSL